MGTVVGGILLLGLLAWILIDGHLLRKKSAKATPEIPAYPYTAGEIKQARHLIFGLACAGYVMALVEWVNPSIPPFTGRRKELTGWFYYSFGLRGVFLYWIAIASLLLFIAMIKKPRGGS